jgi:HEAT repeat protein
MWLLVGALLLASPGAERMLLGPSPFFRHEGMVRARREHDVALLHKAAESKYWDARRLAAEALGPLTPPELLKDPVAVVREAAVRALDVKAPEADLLRLLADKDDAVRAAAAWALRERTNRAPVRALLDDPSIAVRVAALASVGRLSTLRRMAADKDLAEAVPALRMLGEAGGPAEASALFRRLRAEVKDLGKGRGTEVPLWLREQPTASVALARAVGDLARRGVAPGGRELRALLRDLVEKAPRTGPVALLLAEAVGGARDVASAQVLLDATLHYYKTSRQATVYTTTAVRDALHALSREPWPELAPLLAPYLAHRDAPVREAAVRVLAGDAARPALRDPSPAVRATACARIGKAAPLVELAEQEQEPLVLAACARALGRIGAETGAPALAKLLEHDAATVRHAAVGALMRVPHEGRVDRLYAVALTDPDASVRAAAVAVLDFLDADDAAIPHAIADLGHADASVRAHAAAILHGLTAARFGYDPGDPDKGKVLWEQWWKQRTERPKRTGGFVYHVDDLRRKGVDLVLVMDATSSMSGVIRATKARLRSVVAQLRRIVPDLRVRIVAYRDRSRDAKFADAFVTLGSPLTHDARVLEDFLAGVPAYGGGDTPEAVLDGLRDAIGKTAWRDGTYRVVLLFGDAPPHARDKPLLKAVVQEFKGVVHTVDVVGYGANGPSLAMEDFREIAAWGKGVALRLSNEGDLIRELLVLTLGPRFRTAVETLFGL